MSYVPFNDDKLKEAGPWLPYSRHHDGTYTQFRAIFKQHLAGDPSGITLERAAIRILRSVVLFVPHRMGGELGPSGIWDIHFGNSIQDGGVRTDAGLLYDALSLALANPTPDPKWYTRILAARDEIFLRWTTHPRKYTRTTTTIIILLSNALSILDILFLCIQGGNTKNRAIDSRQGCDTNGKAFSPDRPLHFTPIDTPTSWNSWLFKSNQLREGTWKRPASST